MGYSAAPPHRKLHQFGHLSLELRGNTWEAYPTLLHSVRPRTSPMGRALNAVLLRQGASGKAFLLGVFLAGALCGVAGVILGLPLWSSIPLFALGVMFSRKPLWKLVGSTERHVDAMLKKTLCALVARSRDIQVLLQDPLVSPHVPEDLQDDVDAMVIDALELIPEKIYTRTEADDYEARIAPIHQELSSLHQELLQLHRSAEALRTHRSTHQERLQQSTQILRAQRRGLDEVLQDETLPLLSSPIRASVPLSE